MDEKNQLSGSKQIYLAKRHPALSREQFRPRWRNHFAIASALPRWVNVRRYAQCDAIVDVPPRVPISREYDGIGLHWFKSAEARARHIADAKSQQIMETDEDTLFSERVNNFVMPVGERILRDGPRSPFKLFVFLKRKPSVGFQDFLRRYDTDHAVELLAGAGSADRVVLNRDVAAEPRQTGLRFEAIDEISFSTLAAAIDYCNKASDRPGSMDDYLAERVRVLTEEAKLYEVET
jgi:hypothetical protein